MKLLHYLIPLTLAACGTTTEQPSGCQIDSECKEGRVCLEGMCQEPIRDAGVNDAESLDADLDISPYRGKLFALVEKNESREIVFARYDLKTGVLERLKDKDGTIVTAPSIQQIFSVTRPALTPNGEIIAFATHKETRNKRIYTYNLRTSELQLISERAGLPALAWVDDNVLLFSREETGGRGLVQTTIYTKDISSGNQQSLVTLPLDGFIMGLAYDHDFAIFSCPTSENIELLRSDPENRDYQRPIQLCETRVGTNNLTRDDDHFHFGRYDNFEITRPNLNMGSKNTDYSYTVFFPCKEGEQRALCNAGIGGEGIEKVMDVQESFYLGAFDVEMNYAFLDDGRVLHLKDKEERMFEIVGKNFEGEMVSQFRPFAYRP